MIRLLKKIRISVHNALFAAGGFVPLADVGSQSSKLSQIYNTSDLSGFVNGLFKFAISLGAIIAVLRIAWAGYLYMGSADMWSTKSKAKEILGNVTLGILLLLAIWLILTQINPDILKLNAIKNIKPVPVQSGPQTIPETGFAPGGRDPFAAPDCPPGTTLDTAGMGINCI